MLADVVWFDLKYHARRVSTYVCVLIWFLLPWPNVLRKAPHDDDPVDRCSRPLEAQPRVERPKNGHRSEIEFWRSAAIQRDFALETYQVLLSTPVTRRAYLGGRFLASAIVCLAVFGASALGHLYAGSPWAAHPTMAPIQAWNYEWPFLVWPLPFLVEHPDQTWRLPADVTGEIPLMFSLKATRG